jgi:hypothetical protein
MNLVRAVHGSSPPKAVFGPVFTPGWKDDKTIGLSGPFTGLLLCRAAKQDARQRA